MTNFVAMAYTKKQRQDIFTEICDRIIQGESLRSAIVKSEINISTFFDWVSKYKDMADHYARAMEIRAEIMFGEIMEISDQDPEYVTLKFGQMVDSGEIQNRRLQVDSRKWALSKMMPKKYGTKADDQDDNHDNEITIKIV